MSSLCISLPEGCPPNKVSIDIPKQVFRAVQNNPVEDIDFVSAAELLIENERYKDLMSSKCTDFATSFYSRKSKIYKIAKTYNYAYVIRVIISKDLGVLQRSGNHFLLWKYIETKATDFSVKEYEHVS